MDLFDGGLRAEVSSLSSASDCSLATLSTDLVSSGSEQNLLSMMAFSTAFGASWDLCSELSPPLVSAAAWAPSRSIRAMAPPPPLAPTQSRSVEAVWKETAFLGDGK
ncbi:hypothetical protein NHX12_014964 [Muraenolepis orangiensis]|uniref:Uncharacterized protein n=1 Tax=Muraenolepis orangiensis TaxID=630683 RepID=A0A9Q0I3F1_9TELE|nr:hypothetical protein NHX12_014964 [Muraenolepis orangiensis]